MTSAVPLSPPSHFTGTFAMDGDVRDLFSTASGPFSLTPRAVAVPRDESDVSALMEWAHRSGVPLVSRGAGTGMPGGNVGRGVSVDLTRQFSGLGAVDPDGRTVRVGAGVTLAQVDQAARPHGLFLPPLPSSADRCTVGGALANNAAGARSFRYGSVRDWVQSARVVLADGRPVELEAGVTAPFGELHRTLSPAADQILMGWPKVRKNSSGYALDRYLANGDALQLLLGSEGTLGVITEAVLRLAPVPEAVTLALVAVRTLDDISRISTLAETLDATACEFFGRRFVELTQGGPGGVRVPRHSAALLLVELAGSAKQTRAAMAALQSTAVELGADFQFATAEDERRRLWSVRHGASPAIAAATGDHVVSTQFIEDSVVPVDRLPDYVRGVEAILGSVDFDGVVFGHAGDGNAHVNPLVPTQEPDCIERIRRALDETVELVAGLGGTLAGEHGDGRLRAPFQDRIWGATTLEAFRTVKATLDPDEILNPGVILPVSGQDPLDGLGAAWPLATRGGGA